jgi:hypothetical protein
MMTNMRHFSATWIKSLSPAPWSRVPVVFENSGGVWRAAEKSGGLRLIYYLRLRRNQIWMLTIYGKNVTENIPGHVLKRMKEAIENAEDD